MNNTNRSLKPCVFCGTTWTALDVQPAHDHWRAWVECDNCGATGPLGDTEDEVIEAWNTRSKHD